MLYDVFICHASEDKDDFVRSLAEALRALHIEVWYDEFSLRVGDSLRQAIDRGLANSRFGIVVLSLAFFRKRWTQRELNGLVTREMHEGRELVLPIWHEVSRADIIKHSPPLADVYALDSASGMESVISGLLKRLRPNESPLIVAREFLMNKGVTPPIVTDEWWLDVVQFKEAQLRFPDLNVGHRWIFPLPHNAPDHGRERGLNIAWTALQLDWMQEAAENSYCQLTHPARIHEYLRKYPGLLECGRANASVLALYAPQLTIRGFDDGLSDVFDDLLKVSYGQSLQFFSYSDPDTIDGNEPLCGEAVAWRHCQFGNYTDSELASSFVNAHTHDYSRTLYEGFACLVWLLTDAASWLPEAHRRRLMNGMRTRTYWWVTSTTAGRGKSIFHEALWRRSKSTFRFSREIRSGLRDLVQAALNELGIAESADVISRRFMEGGFVEGYFEEQQRNRELRSRSRHRLRKKRTI
ncbi:MAG: TIR domain-containing protein [Dongiaceae bacterium]